MSVTSFSNSKQQCHILYTNKRPACNAHCCAHDLHFQAGLDSDVNIVSFWSSLTDEGIEVEGTVWHAFKLQTESLSCANLNAHWHYSANRLSRWQKTSPLPSYTDKLLGRSRDMAGITLRVGILVVCIRLSHQLINTVQCDNRLHAIILTESENKQP